MPPFKKFDSFVEALGRKVHDLNADVLKIMLSNVAPSASDTVKADIIEIAAQNGYPAGGLRAGNNSYAQTRGVAKLTADDVLFSAEAGGFGPLRYAILYNDSAVNGELIGFYDYGSSVSLNYARETVRVDLGQGDGIFTSS